MTLEWIFPIFVGYALGSFLPAYFITRILKHGDIREMGDGNPGVTNVMRSVGIVPAVITASFDMSKGLLAMALAAFVFHAPATVVYLGGVSAVYGHVFPFYLRFRGGRGAATSTGMLIVFLARLSITEFDPAKLWITLLYLIFFVLCMYFSTGNENFMSLTVLPVLSLALVMNAVLTPALFFILFLIFHIFVVSLMNAGKLKLFTMKEEEIRFWRIFIRPAAMLFLLFGLFMDRMQLLTLVGGVFALSFAADIARIVSKSGRFFGIYKLSEKRRISSITTFMMGLFVTFALFEWRISTVSVGFLVFGDMMAKVVGMSYGKRKLFEENGKTLEGFLAFLGAAVSVAYFMWMSGAVPLWIGLAGALVASVIESSPFPVDDNLSVPLISGTVMAVLERIV